MLLAHSVQDGLLLAVVNGARLLLGSMRNASSTLNGNLGASWCLALLAGWSVRAAQSGLLHVLLASGMLAELASGTVGDAESALDDTVGASPHRALASHSLAGPALRELGRRGLCSWFGLGLAAGFFRWRRRGCNFFGHVDFGNRREHHAGSRYGLLKIVDEGRVLVQPNIDALEEGDRGRCGTMMALLERVLFARLGRGMKDAGQRSCETRKGGQLAMVISTTVAASWCCCGWWRRCGLTERFVSYSRIVAVALIVVVVGVVRSFGS
mmetsp:Transcript_4774/g.13754  ORF Transcript_4774/g.13754 Transcript_4774/m.13754 type:complete len:268 (-) Transcript_4774:1004-1807(-)